MIKDTLNKYQAWDIVEQLGAGYSNKYSYEGFDALFDYMEEYSEEIGEDLEFDFIAWCCDFTEYENLKELQQNYKDIKDMDDLRDNTTVIEIEDTDRFIIQNF